MKNDYPSRLFPFTNQDGSVDWICEYPDLPGCTGIGSTPQEALSDGEEAKIAWLEVYFEDHHKYPGTTDIYSKDYNGKILLRVSRTMHRDLVLCAESEGISLNSLCSQFLSAELGKKQGSKTIKIT